MDLLTCFKARPRSGCQRPCLDGYATTRADITSPLRRAPAPQRNNYEDAKCASEIKALNACMSAQAKKPKEVNTINYHLQRLARGG